MHYSAYYLKEQTTELHHMIIDARCEYSISRTAGSRYPPDRENQYIMPQCVQMEGVITATKADMTMFAV